MCEASSCGAEIFSEKIPVLDVTKKICKTFVLDPLRLISSGSMLIAVKNPDVLLNKLSDAGILATVIGKATKEGIFLVTNGVKKEVEPPNSDEIYKLSRL
jgi:hydrogenase expression/formation protein HypE